MNVAGFAPLVGMVLAGLALPACGETLDFLRGTEIELADAATGSRLLGMEDAYLRRMSAFDRAARMRVAAAPSLGDFSQHAAENARGFSAADGGRVRGAVARVQTLVEPLRLAFPPRIVLVRTTGGEDIGEAYCRGPAIILPEKYFAPGAPDLTMVLLHELFHVFSSHHPELRERLYGLLEFRKCPDHLVLPPREEQRRLTNPDAMNLDYYTVLPEEGRDVAVMPVFLGKGDGFDPAAPGGAFAQVDLMLVEIVVRDGAVTAALDGEGRVVMRRADSVPAFRSRMARNTHYILHPEEVLADNFMHGVRKTPRLAAPEFPARVIEIMQTAPLLR